MKLGKFGIVSAFGLLAVVTSSAQASMILPGLPDGTYRVAFVSTGSYQATVPANINTTRSISYWASKAANEAHASTNPLISASISTWYPLMSISDQFLGDKSATEIAHLNPDATSGVDTLPIYNLAGQLIANNAADLWDSLLTNPIQFNPNGGIVGGNQFVWTGTYTEGFQYGPVGDGDFTTVGRTALTDERWVFDPAAVGVNTFQRMYAISGAFTPGAVPEPATLSLLATGSLLMLRRKRN